MIRSNYHIHSTFCDGRNTLEEMAESAYNCGLKSIGFSSHFSSDYPEECAIDYTDVGEYLKRIEDLKKAYSGRMDIYTSFEFDFYMNTGEAGKHFKDVRDKVDYTLFSIHTMGYLPNGEMAIIDADRESFYNGVNEIYKSPQDFVEKYYAAIAEMALKYKPDIIGHIDLIKKNNQGLFDEESEYYKEAVAGALDSIKEAGSIVEINTGGVYRYGREYLYPSRFILEEIKKRDIPVTVNGDTHFRDGINYMYDEVEELLRETGFDSIMVFDGKNWISESL